MYTYIKDVLYDEYSALNCNLATRKVAAFYSTLINVMTLVSG